MMKISCISVEPKLKASVHINKDFI